MVSTLSALIPGQLNSPAGEDRLGSSRQKCLSHLRVLARVLEVRMIEQIYMRIQPYADFDSFQG